MPKPDHKKILLYVGAAAVVALLGYEWWKNRKTTTTTTATPVAATPVVPTTSLPSLAVTTSNLPSVMAPVAQASIPSTTPAGIAANVYQTVHDWAMTDGRAPVMAMAAANNPTEYAGMYDIITNVWDKGGTPNTTQTNFWNALRAKYDTLVGPPNNTW